VLLPGDPARAEWVATEFLDGVRCVNRIRGEPGFTGSWRGLPVSVQATGMGTPSLSIYAHELAAFYGARVLIRIGTCGGLDPAIKVRELVLGQAASSDSAVNRNLFGAFEFAPSADFGLLRLAADIAAEQGVAAHVAPMVSSDVFYCDDPLGRYALLRAHGVRAVDMETSALYTIAARFGARALSICTVVDCLVTREETAFSERQALFQPMVRLALETARRIRLDPAS
jgi:purine-nucleoside phosphorylase